MRKRTLLSTAIATLSMSSGSAIAADSFAPWLTQVRITKEALSAANWGKYQILGVVDTGINASNPAFAYGQVSLARSSCAGVTFTCATGIADDYGHGTAVAAIAAGYGRYPWGGYYGGYYVLPNSVVSVAPQANIVAQKVFAAGQQSYFTDVASGINKAADAGAAVINLSLTYWNGPEVVAAINYATGKGAMIVWAGGNDATMLLNGASTTGLTSSAIRQLVFAGSVTPSNTLSSFSNTPGTGSLVTSGGTRTAYSARWTMAPGESIIAPNISGGPDSWGAWTGTSMSAPIVSGSLILLEAAWPILKTRRTAATLLLSTTTDLGAAGVDSTYGTGIINVENAFRPYGPLTVTGANGQTYYVSSLTGSMITGGALGSLWSVKYKLSNYTAFDSYSRNYSVNLSGLIQSQPTAWKLNPLPTNSYSAPRAMGFGVNPDIEDRRMGYASHTDPSGRMVAFGYGVPAHLSFGGIESLAQGGGMAAFGMKLSDATRIAFSWSGTPTALQGTPAAWSTPWTQPSASALGMGMSHALNDRLTVGMTLGSLNEKGGLLGTTYDASSPLSLGATNRTRSYGLSAGINLDRNNSVLLETGYASTAASSAGGFFAGTTDLLSRSYGASFMSRNLLADDDRLTLFVKLPLRVVSGQAGVVMPQIDEQGIAHYHTEWTSLVPDARERHFGLAYDRPLGRSQSFSIQAGLRRDVLNMPGVTDASIGAAWTMKF